MNTSFPSDPPRGRAYPKPQGLWHPCWEKDGCGLGAVVDIRGRRSHSVVADAVAINASMNHRARSEEDPAMGDGAGLLTQMPDAFLRKALQNQGIALPPLGDYGAGIVLLSQDPKTRDAFKDVCERMVRLEGQDFIAWRKVPVNSSVLGKGALKTEPAMQQLIIGKGEDFKGGLMDFERKLYRIRLRIEHAVNSDQVPDALGGEYSNRQMWLPGAADFHIASLSARTLVYKALVLPSYLGDYFPDLNHELYQSALAITHGRFATNTFPDWTCVQPLRTLAYSGAVNSVLGNTRAMQLRFPLCEREDLFGEDFGEFSSVVEFKTSDATKIDGVFEWLHLAGYPLLHPAAILLPPSWKVAALSESLRHFYQYHACLMESWDGPASMIFSDGKQVGAMIDRNGLRPLRYYRTADQRIILASEAGVLQHLPPQKVVAKGRVAPGEFFLVDVEDSRLVPDSEVKAALASARPYGQWLKKHCRTLESLPEQKRKKALQGEDLAFLQRAFGFSLEDLRFLLGPTAASGNQPLGAMGSDIPLAVLSHRPRLLYDYFKQVFAQVTNPPLDSIREEKVTSTEVFLGGLGNILKPSEKDCQRLLLPTPLLTREQLERIRAFGHEAWEVVDIPMLMPPHAKGKTLEAILEQLGRAAKRAIQRGAKVLILSDRGVDKDHCAVPALLGLSAVRYYLMQRDLMGQVSLVLESGEPREVHHFAVLIGFGAHAICPYLALDTLEQLCDLKLLAPRREDALRQYLKGSVKAVVKTMAKVGVASLSSYCGAQLFESVGINSKTIGRYFKYTSSRVGGIGLSEIARDARVRHGEATAHHDSLELDSGGIYQWRKEGEYHAFNPESIRLLQKATRENCYETFKAYAQLINNQCQDCFTLRGLLSFKDPKRPPLDLKAVESVESIMKRFKTGAISFGSISQEAHETLAVAMNRVGGKSNSGEGGEDSARFTRDPNGDSRRSAIKQVASGRFGVTASYLIDADEIQIKLAQGAKPGEGGELPGKKVYPWIAKVRHATSGVTLISPPPHHDLSSTEDLAQLIHDLRSINPTARINVKLAANVGIGAVASVVAKVGPDVILISGHDGGTGASPLSSIQHAGLPWELGLAEANQALLLNKLRGTVRLETDGQLKTGRDVAIAALLGAEEFGFATAPLVSLGCLMMRACHKNTCPVGVATQDPRLRKKFQGKPEHVVRFMRFIAQQLREIMASLGISCVEDLVGKANLLEAKKSTQAKWRNLDLSNLLHVPLSGMDHIDRSFKKAKRFQIEHLLDVRKVLPAFKEALETGKEAQGAFDIYNTDRSVGTYLGGEIVRRFGEAGLKAGNFRAHFQGTAGHSFGAFIPQGLHLHLEGDANDYVGKGLSGGRIVVRPPSGQRLSPNVIVGDVCFYGATRGEAYIAGEAGERFCIRNSGIQAVVEGLGDHGCEYMTGGRVVVLGKTGHNFAAGMSGGIAYVWDPTNLFEEKVNLQTVQLSRLADAPEEEIEALHAQLKRHFAHTASPLAEQILRDFPLALPSFSKVLPIEYARMLRHFKKVRSTGLKGPAADLAAFQAAMASS